jgi:hypothetical protein
MQEFERAEKILEHAKFKPHIVSESQVDDLVEKLAREIRTHEHRDE